MPETHIFGSFCMFSPQPSSRVLRDSPHVVHVCWILLHKGQYHVFVTYRNSDLPTMVINSNYAVSPHQWSVKYGWQGAWRVNLLLPNLRTAPQLSLWHCLTYAVRFTLLSSIITSRVNQHYSCCYLSLIVIYANCCSKIIKTMLF